MDEFLDPRLEQGSVFVIQFCRANAKGGEVFVPRLASPAFSIWWKSAGADLFSMQADWDPPRRKAARVPGVGWDEGAQNTCEGGDSCLT